MYYAKKIKIIINPCFIFFIFSFSTHINNKQGVVSLPFYLLPFTNYPYIGNSMAQFLFWISGCLLTLLFIILIIVLFYPKAHNCIEKKTDSGKIAVQKKAIENFVLIAAKEEPFIVDPTVKSVIKKKKIKIYIQGKIRKAFQTGERQTAFIRKVNTNLNELFGAEQIILTEIIFKDYHEKNTKTKSKVL
ncbi:alkaline shock response membrane anchor protein AmaP [Enterococcus faecalis]|uniref:alkaline shock response membrane anchor protein AmaP n=1 Tax=Enterococcus faecalis TaxID=1351 RepID=UPI001E51FC60|nr:alkaline shock response membrane anchor protein AmaP [Enterococcus faecalis]